MDALMNQATKIPINQRCRQLNPLGKVFHIIRKAPALATQMGKAEKKMINAVLCQFLLWTTYCVFHGLNV